MAGSTLGRLFGRSPIKPMQRHMELANTCAQVLIEYFEQSLQSNWEEASKCYDRIRELEEQADEVKMEIRKNLPNRMFLPVARSDLLELLHVQDAIANEARDISGMMLGRKMEIPKAIAENMLELVRAACNTSAQALTVIKELEELLETGFSGREVRMTESMIERLDLLESKADKREISVRAGLFAIENELPPIHVMFLYQLISRLGDLADCAERVGARLRVLLIH